MKILIMDADRKRGEALGAGLLSKIPGSEFLIAVTYEDGLRQATEYRADITLMDLLMPDKTWEGMVQSISHFPPPVIVVTDMEDPMHHIELLCYAHRAQNFFSRAELDKLVACHKESGLAHAITKAHWRNILPKQCDALTTAINVRDGTTE